MISEGIATNKHIITASQSRLAAQLFNIGSIVAVLVFPLLMIWIALSIFVYASIAHHPNPRVRAYNRWAGYRFYGAAGFMIPFGSPIYGIFGNWHGVLALWAIMFIVVIPWGIWSVIKVYRDEWQETVVEAALPVAKIKQAVNG